jgi:probable rRNA maturation factor
MKKVTQINKKVNRDAAACRTRTFLHSTVPTGGLRRDLILHCAQLAAKKLHNRTCLISFIIVSDREMAKMHRQYAGVPGTTDVLTFDLSDPQGGIEGEIYICLDQAKRQAAEYKVTLSDEVARLAIHGVLHLADYDDHTEADRKVMKSLEDEILLRGRKSL